MIVVGNYLEGVLYVIDGNFYSDYDAEQYLEKHPVADNLTTKIVTVNKVYDWEGIDV